MVFTSLPQLIELKQPDRLSAHLWPDLFHYKVTENRYHCLGDALKSAKQDYASLPFAYTSDPNEQIWKALHVRSPDSLLFLGNGSIMVS